MNEFCQKAMIAADGAVIKYVDAYQNNQNTVLFLHGMGGKGKQFFEIAKQLTDTHRIVWLDYRGHGKSKLKGKFSQEQTAKDVRMLIDYLGLENITIAGVSMGAHVIFRYVRKYAMDKLKSIVIIDMTPKLPNNDTWTHGFQQGKYTEEKLARDMQQRKKNRFGYSGELLADGLNYLRPNGRQIKRASFFHKLLGRIFISNLVIDVMDDMFSQDYREELPKITVPCAIVYAKPGSIYNEGTAKYMQSRIIGSELFPVPDVPHERILMDAQHIACVICKYS